jgi:GPH family glycoside/pentoside/hexuronide:cation symporter
MDVCWSDYFCLVDHVCLAPSVPAGPNADEWIWPVFFYLAVMVSLLYGLGYTMFNVPHITMGYEMTTDYNERTHLFKWRQIIYSAAGFLTPWLLTFCMLLEGDQAQALKGSQGVVVVSACIAIIVLLSGLPSVLFCKENVADHKKETKVRFFDVVKFTFNNKPFWLVVVSNFISKFCMAITGIFFMYIFLYHISKGDQVLGAAYMAIIFTAINVTCPLAMPIVAKLSESLGKKKCLLIKRP